MVSGMVSYMGDFIADLSPITTLIVGVMLGAVVLEVIIGAIRK